VRILRDEFSDLALLETKLPPVHPGEILRETLHDLGLSMNQLAQEIHVPANRISASVAGRRSITGETALRLARYFATSPAYWMNLQRQEDLGTHQRRRARGSSRSDAGQP
jgi:antitoxin HigA-1